MKIKEIQSEEEIGEEETKNTKLKDESDQLVYSNIFKHLNKGEMYECIELVEKDHSLVYSTEDHYGMTVLHLASLLKMRRLVKTILDIVSDDDLLSRNFDINKVDNNNNTALHYACVSSIKEITSPSATSTTSTTISTPHIPIVPSNNDHTTSSSTSSFGYLKEKKSNRFSIVKLLLERGSMPTIPNKMNLLPIHLACKEIDFKTVELLVENNDDQDIKISEPHAKVLDAFNFSLLFQSLQSNNYLTKHEKERNEKKRDIILSKIDPTLKCVKDGPTCLHYSLSNLKRIKELTIELIKKDKSPSPPLSSNTDRQQQLSKDISIVERNHPLIKLIKLLLQKSCKPNHIDVTTGKTAFQQFIHIFPSDENELEQFLQVDGHDEDQDDKGNNETFKEMIKILIYSIIRLLYQYKYDFTLSSEKSIMDQDKDIEETPLGQCSMYKSKFIILEQLLLFFNQSIVLKESEEKQSQQQQSTTSLYQKIINSINGRGQPALFIACQYDNCKAVDLLLEYGANPNIKDKFGCSMLHESLNFKHYDIAKKLVLCGSNVNEAMSVYPQSTPLHIATSQANFDMCNFLINHGSLLNVYDSEKQTPKEIIEKIYNDQESFIQSNYSSNTIKDSEIDEIKEQIRDLYDFFNYHIQINLIEISSLVVFKGDYKEKIQQFLKSKERNPNILESYMNNIFKDESKLDQLVDQSNFIQIPLKEIKTITKRIKIKLSTDQYFKYVNLHNQTFNHLLNIIKNRFKPSLIDSIDQFQKNYIKSIILLPNILISDDKDIEFIKDDDEIQVEFK